MRPPGTWATSVLLAFGLLATQVPPLQAESSERWLLVPVFAGGKTPEGVLAGAITSAVETELRAAGQSPLPNDSAAGLFEGRSAEPVLLAPDQLRRLSRSVAEASRHLALGELPEARRAMEGVDALSDPARDFLNRDATRARKIFDNCLMAAYLFERAQEHRAAVRQMLDCARGFPGSRPEGRAYPAEVPQLFEEAMTQLKTATLRVLSTGRSGCSVRLNGREVGKAPLELTNLRAGATRVQLECEPNAVGRIHSRELKAGENEVAIDPRFDAAAHSQGGLWLAYATEREREEHAANDVRAIGEALGVQRVVALWVLPGALGSDVAARPVGIGALREVGRASFAADSGYARGGASKLASALVGWARAQPGGPGPAAGAIGQADLHPAGVSGVGSSAGSSAAREHGTVPEPSPWTQTRVPAAPGGGRQRYTQQHATAGAILAVIGGASSAASWAMYAVRQPERKRIGDPGAETPYKRFGLLALTTAGVGTTLLSLSEFFWLPDDPGIPAAAWVVGGLGLAASATAVTLSLTVADCKIDDDRVKCQSFWSDHFFGPMLFMHALPLLTAPLWYGLRAMFRPANVQVALATDASGMPQLRLTGEF